MSGIRNIRRFEILIYSLIWGLVFLFPLFLLVSGNARNFDKFWHDLLRLIPFFVLFLIHTTLLFRLFVRKKYWDYFFSSLILVILVAFLSMFIVRWINEVLPTNIKPPPPRPHAIRGNPTLQFLTRFSTNIVLGILILGMNVAIKMFIQWIQRENEIEKLQKENAESKLSNLRQQISPHFFMNTLNNIHALIDFDSEKAKDSVVKLSKLMRILLYEEETHNFTLKKEIDFLNDYIEIMKIRLHEKVDVTFSYPETIPVLELPPLLFINFVENAFKYGVLPNKPSEISIEFILEDDFLNFKVFNTYDEEHSKKSTGTKIGMSNSVKRLDLIYRNKYSIETNPEEDQYHVEIKIPLS